MITKQDVIQFGEKIVDNLELSNRVNPFDKETGTCNYYNGSSHCIVGYWLHTELGVNSDALNDIEDASADVAIQRLIESKVITQDIDKEAISLLSNMQVEADGVADTYNESIDPFRWGNVIVTVLEKMSE